MNIPTAIVIAGAMIAVGVYAASEQVEAQQAGPFFFAVSTQPNVAWRMDAATGGLAICHGTDNGGACYSLDN